MRALEQARDREMIFELALRAARSRARFAALLSVHAEQLRGRRALAEPGLQAAGIAALQIPRGAVPALEDAVASRAAAVAPLATGESFLDGLLEQLGGGSSAALILPIALGARTVALIVAHRGGDAIALEDAADLAAVATAANAALTRALAARRQATVPPPEPAPRAPTEAPRAAKPRSPTMTDDSPEGYQVEVTVEPTLAQKRAVLVELRRAGAWEALAAATRDLVGEGMEHGEPDEDEQLALLLELGRIEAEHLGRPARAVEAWRAAQTIDAGDPRVLDSLEALFVREELWPPCLDLLDQRAALVEDDHQRAEILLRLAAIAREHLDDGDRALAAYERILARDPDHETASAALESLYTERAQWQPLAALLLDRAQRHDDAGALKTVANVYEDRVRDPHAALLVWLAVIRREPDVHTAVLLEQLDRLAPLAGAWDEVLGECTALAEELAPAHPEAAARVWHLIGRWHRDHLANRDAAADAFGHALRANAGDLDALTELLELLRTDGRWADLIALLAQRAEAHADPARRSELYAELGELLDAQLGQPAEALAYYERALDGAPDPAPILVELHRLHLAAEAWAPLGELLPRLIEALGPTAPPAVLAELWTELGGILVDHLGRPGEAVQAYRDALALDPKHAAAHRGLARAYEATGETDALLDATEAELDAAPRAEQLQRYGDLAAAWQELARHERAAACWRKLLALDPAHAAAHQGLARALRAAHEWPELAAAYRAHIRVAEPAARIEPLLELAGVLEDRLGDADGATAAYQEVLAIEPDHRAALDVLARLHDRAGRIQPALAALQRLLDLTATDFPARAELLARTGYIHLSARDAANARVAFAQAIAIDLRSAPAHEGMARVHVQQGELVAAGEELLRAAQLWPTDADALRCLADAAWLYRHRLGDPARARDCLHRILERAPEHADARQALAELLAETRQWEDLWPHLEQEVERARTDPAMPAKDRGELYARAARCAVELGRFPVAIELHDAACALDPRPALLLDRAAALHRSDSLEPAAAAYQAIASQHAQALDRGQLVGVYRRLAQIHTALGKAAQAQAYHHKVLDLEPRHRETLEELVELNLARARYDEAIANLRELAAAAPLAERAPLLERIGDLYRDKLANTARAASTYLEALELDAGNHRVLQRLLDLQSSAGQWRAAVETIDRFLEHEAAPARRGSYYLASAEIRRTELRDRAGALACYEAALDELLRPGPTGEPPTAATRARALDAFHALHDLVTADQHWKQLEQSYRRMIKRLPKDDPALVQLWDALGEIYRTGLEHPQSAIEALEIAHGLDPGRSPHRARVLAELYAQTGARPPEPSGKRVELDPTSPDAYRALGRASLDAGKLDEAWCVSRALVFWKQASAEETALYRRHQALEVKKATGILDEDAWGFVRHPDEDAMLSSIFGLIWEGVAALRAGPAKTFELKPKERMAVEEGTGVIAKIFRHAARVLNVPLPDVYVQPRRSGRLMLATCLDKGRLAPAVIVGRDLMTGYRDTELAASVGALLALLRPAYYAKAALAGTDELEGALAAAGQLVGVPAGRPATGPLAAAFAPELQKRLTRPAAEALRARLARLPEPADIARDLARWRAAVDATAHRAGLLVSGELAAAARMLASEPAAGARPGQRVQELVAYSVSPAYFAVRQHLGVAIA